MDGSGRSWYMLSCDGFTKNVSGVLGCSDDSCTSCRQTVEDLAPDTCHSEPWMNGLEIAGFGDVDTVCAADPTPEPTDEPTDEPTTGMPTTAEPTKEPTTDYPTRTPTDRPTREPTDRPTAEPTTASPTTVASTTEVVATDASPLATTTEEPAA